MSWSFFDSKRVLADLKNELRVRGSPLYPNRRWMAALAIAESLDMMRQVKARNDALWPDPRPIVVRYLEEDDPHRLIYLGLTIATDQPAAEIEGVLRTNERESDRTYRDTHKQRIADYNKGYRQRNREKFLAWQRDYRMANADRLNALRRAKRRVACDSVS
jgi:hypothetical protein